MVSSLAMAAPTMTIIKVTYWAKAAVVFYPRTSWSVVQLFPAKETVEQWSATQGRPQKLVAVEAKYYPRFRFQTRVWISLRLGYYSHGRSSLMSIRDGISQLLLKSLAHSQTSITSPYLQTYQTSSLIHSAIKIQKNEVLRRHSYRLVGLLCFCLPH